MPSSDLRPGRLLLLPLLLALAAASETRAQKLSEVMADHAGADDHEYVEVLGNPVTSYATHRVVFVDGNAAAPGHITAVYTVGTTNGAGLWSTGFVTSIPESATFTVLLVNGFSGVVGMDLDADDDGTLDAAPWTTLVDSVAFTDGAAGARTYSTAVLGPSFDGLAVRPGGAARFPYFRDTNAASDWKRLDEDGEGLPGFTGTLAPGEAIATPGYPTQVHLADYWGGVDPSTAATLRTTLHAAIENHVRYEYTASSTDTWDILNLADQDPVDSTKVLDIYKNERYTKISGGTGVYNREHSWPNSLGFSSSSSVPYTDCHHLYVSEVGYNADRGNKPYASCASGCTERPTTLNYGQGGGSGTYPGNSNWYNASVWETWNYRRGDVARAQLYLDVRYEGGTHAWTGASEPNLILTDNPAQIGTGAPYMGMLASILTWHASDAVDSVEMQHHEVVAGFQGNRNPFVDHPEWVACVFQSSGCAARLGDAATIDTGSGWVGETRLLGTSPQTATSWTWAITAAPGGSTATLSSTAVRNPTFTPDVAGPYLFELTASNGTATSVTTVSLAAAAVPCTPDADAPEVIAPAPLVLAQTLCCGAFGGVSAATSPALASFLAGATADDGCDATPSALAPQVAGLDVTSATCLEAGTTAVTFRFQDATENVGTAAANVTVQMFGDLNLDGMVDPSDYVILRDYLNFVSTPRVPPFSATLTLADLNHDATVDPGDFVMIRDYLNFVTPCLAP